MAKNNMKRRRTGKRLLAAAAVLAAFAGGLFFGPVLCDALRGGVDEQGHPAPAPGNGASDYLVELVDEAAALYRAEPVDALYNETYRTVVPEINGYEMDREATLARLQESSPGEPVSPVWRELPAAVTAADFPHALIERGNPARKQVSFMVNVAWGNEYLPEMLDLFDRYDVRTTFFPVGRWAERFPELLREIDARGHELGNHGYADWEVFSDLDYEAARESLLKTNGIVYELTGQRPRFFTPHKGEFNDAAREAAADLNMRLLLWTLDTVDWRRPGAEVMARRILDHLEPGAIILMHPTEQSADFLQLVLPELKMRGYRVVPMGELLSPSPELPQVTLSK